MLEHKNYKVTRDWGLNPEATSTTLYEDKILDTTILADGVEKLSFLNPATIRPEHLTDKHWEDQGRITFELTNALRVARGLPVFKLDPYAVKTAKVRADDMLKKNYFSHDVSDYESWNELYYSLGGSTNRTLAENISAGNVCGIDAFRGWTLSRDHRSLMEDEFSTGLGVAICFSENSKAGRGVMIFTGETQYYGDSSLHEELKDLGL